MKTQKSSFSSNEEFSFQFLVQHIIERKKNLLKPTNEKFLVKRKIWFKKLFYYSIINNQVVIRPISKYGD